MPIAQVKSEYLYLFFLPHGWGGARGGETFCSVFLTFYYIPFCSRLILMAKKLEDHLYRSAHTKEEYVDLASLKRRLHLIAKANSIAGFNDGGEDGSNVSLAGSTGVLHIAGAGMIFNQNASTIKAMARTSWLQERHQQHNSVASFTDRQKQSNTSQNSISTMSRLLPHDISINSKDKLQRQEKKKLVLLDRVEIAATTAPAIVSKTGSSGDKSIPQLIGITLQSSQTCPRDDNCVPQQHAQQSVMIGMQPQTDDGNFRILQIELRKKQLTLTHVQQQMVRSLLHSFMALSPCLFSLFMLYSSFTE